MELHGRRGTALAAGALLVALVGGGCTSEDDGADPAPTKSASPSPTESTEAAPAPPLDVRSRVVTGTLPRARRSAATTKVGAVVSRWFDAAYLGGEYPRSEFSTSFPAFTSRTTARARRDVKLMSNAALGPRISGVRATDRVVRVDLLGHRRRPVGATAQFRLVFQTSGEAVRRVRVTGRLLLTPTKRGWRVVGYNVSRSAGPVPKPAPSATEEATS